MILAGWGAFVTQCQLEEVNLDSAWIQFDQIGGAFGSHCEQIFLASCILSGGSTSTFITETEKKTQRYKYVECYWDAVKNYLADFFH